MQPVVTRQNVRQHDGGIGNAVALQRPVKRPPRDVERLGYRVVGFPLLDQLPGMGGLLRGELGLAAHLHATSDRRRAARPGAFLNQRAFEFGEDADYLPHGAARGRRGVNRFREGAEGHTSCLQVVQKADEVPQRATQPVELPDDKCIILGERLETLG